MALQLSEQTVTPAECQESELGAHNIQRAEICESLQVVDLIKRLTLEMAKYSVKV